MQHAHDLLSGAVAKQLPLVLLVPVDAVTFDLLDEVLRRIAGEGGAAVAGIFRNEIFRLRIAIGEVAATAAGDADLLAQGCGVIEHGDALAALRDLRRAKHASGAGAEHNCIMEGFLKCLIRWRGHSNGDQSFADEREPISPPAIGRCGWHIRLSGPRPPPRSTTRPAATCQLSPAAMRWQTPTVRRASNSANQHAAMARTKDSASM